LISITLIVHSVSLPGCVSYNPAPLEEVPFKQRVETQSQGGVRVAAAALGTDEARKLFGVPLDRHGIQPVWLEIENGDEYDYLFFQQTVHPDYYAPLEAAYKSRYSPTRRGNRHIVPGTEVWGFVFTPLDEGTKHVRVGLLGPGGKKDFDLFVRVPGGRFDHEESEFDNLYSAEELPELDKKALIQAVKGLPCCTTNKRGDRSGDPLNLAIVGSFKDLLEAFAHARWDETEVLDLTTGWRAAWSFLFGSEYRYSPMSNLYLFGRSQDVALQKARATIHERNHLRLWLSPLRHEGQKVWVGQVSRDIGVKFTWRTWNLTTHAIDPDIDDSREAVVGDLLSGHRGSRVGFVPGIPPSEPDHPSRNLMNDPYYTDGYRAVIMLSEDPVEQPHVFSWADPASRQ
jgi:hypothetical protein